MKKIENNKEKYTIEDLLNIMAYLRSEKGCPWDRKQDHESLLEPLLEESYEVMDAIKSKDIENLKEELGDLLLQIIFHAQIENEKENFSFSEVVDGIAKKLIFRHPHVFSTDEVKDAKEVKEKWDKLKMKEKNQKKYSEVLEAVPNTFPGLLRAYKIQKKASKIGFDWETIEPAIEKVYEELGELKEAIEKQEKIEVMEEYGDLLFSVVNISRFIDINPEFALTNAVEKFINRFRNIEIKALQKGYSLEELTLKEMDELWDEVKALERRD